MTLTFDRFEVGTKFGTDKTLIPSDESVVVTFAAAEHKETEIAGCDTARLVFTYGIGAKKLANSDKITVRNVSAELPSSTEGTGDSVVEHGDDDGVTDGVGAGVDDGVTDGVGAGVDDGPPLTVDRSPSMILYVLFMAICAGGIVALRLKRK